MALRFFSCNFASLKAGEQQHEIKQVKVSRRCKATKKSVEEVISRVGIMSSSSPHESLHSGNWVKLICGASFEDVADIRNLSLIYTLAGVDCIDCAAEASVVNAVNEGIEAATQIIPLRRPWVMISVNDDRQDVHFRKAEFDPEDCPLDCARPCEMVCPANAISINVHEANVLGKFKGGVITERCYGCGRCFPVCPYDRISPFIFHFLYFFHGFVINWPFRVGRVSRIPCLQLHYNTLHFPFLFLPQTSLLVLYTYKYIGSVTYVREPTTTSELLKRHDVDAIEIHTSGRQSHMFKELWSTLVDSIGYVKLIAVSLPDLGDSTLPLMNTMYSTMEPCLHCYNLWQLDGRPMSGDIGRGATKEAINFSIRLAALKDRPPGFLQLAGGTNLHTVDGLKKKGLFRTTDFLEKGEVSEAKSLGPPALIGGVAYGGYARKIVGKVLHKMQLQHGLTHIEEHHEYLFEALKVALDLVGTVKCYDLSAQSG